MDYHRTHLQCRKWIMACFPPFLDRRDENARQGNCAAVTGWIFQCLKHWIVMQETTTCTEPDSRQPKQHHRAEQPQNFWSSVESGDIWRSDVQRQHQNGHVARTGSDCVHPKTVGGDVPTARHLTVLAAQFCIALDKGAA